LVGEFDPARRELQRAYELNLEAGAVSGISWSLERLAEAEIALGNRAHAATLLGKARPSAEESPLRSHLVMRLLGVEIAGAPDERRAMASVAKAERTLADANRVHEPCSMNFRVQAASACAEGGDLVRARRHLADAERIAGMWQGGSWPAAVWATGPSAAGGRGARPGCCLVSRSSRRLCRS
jgi:hypothetical protein